MRLFRKRVFYIGAGVIVAFLVLVSFWFTYLVYFYQSGKEKEVYIPKGAGLKSIAHILRESGVIKDERLFIAYVFLRGKHGGLRAGEYRFLATDSMAKVVEKLVRGEVIIRKVTIPEGLTMYEIGELLEKKGVLSGKEFVTKARDKELIENLLGDPSIDSLEGYLFPDTYFYTKGITPEEFIRMMVSRFKQVYTSLKSSPKAVELGDREIVVLASIIEKETAIDSERPLISAVFYNRLRRGMKLQSDPTVIYALGDRFDGNLKKEHLQIKNSYNTYVISGLPPGPIANPGKESLKAALNPADVDYLYFVADRSGTHHFSSNYKDHLKAVNRYQKQPSQAVD